ncbi:hypothetical protein R1sor_017060 [Riccia sorocarpa]|uniref:Cytochrome P450 n=1 Tax=Riccia sorocarpa TaxID=122646 RepID=A0ABD3I650_9MARC
MASMWNGQSSILSDEGYMTLIIVLAVTVLWLLWSASSYFRNRNQLPLPPGPWGFPFIGQTFSYILASGTADGSRQWIQKQITKYGPIFKWRLMGNWVVMLEQPEGNKFIFQSEGTLNHILWPSAISTLHGPESLITTFGEQHKLVRRQLNRFFDHSAMTRYLDGLNQNAVRHFTNHWQGKKQVVALDMTNLYTFSTICNMMLTIEEGLLMDKFLVNCGNWARGLMCLPINLPGFKYYEAHKARQVVFEMLDRLLEQRRREIAEDHLMEVEKIDVLNSLLTVPDEKGNLLPDSCIKDNFLLILLAGYDTSSRTLALTIYYIAKNPSVYEEIIKEHKAIMEGQRRSGKDDDDELSMEDISAMKYTWSAIKEVIRLNPAAPGGFRKNVTDLEYKGYHIPKGWLMMWNNQHSHYNPEYFKEPLKFDPSRWKDPPVPFTYLPFGGGPHICLGNELAKMEMLIFMQHLVKRYSWSLVDASSNEVIIRDPFPRLPNKTLITVKQIVNF